MKHGMPCAHLNTPAANRTAADRVLKCRGGSLVHVLFVIGTQLLLSFSANSSIYQLSVRATTTGLLAARSLLDQMIDLTLVEHQTCSMSSPAPTRANYFYGK
jgi:hypothetical protein